MHPTSRVPHVVRGTFAATIATFAALVSHVAGGGTFPGVLGFVAPLLLSLFVCVMLAGRTLSMLRLSVSVAASQMLFHALFVLGTPPGAQASGAGSSQHHDHAAMMLTPVSPATIELVQGTTTMWIAHAFAAVLTVALLYRGERTLDRLVALAARCAAWLRIGNDVPRTIPVLLRPVRALAATSRGWSLLTLIVGATQRRRGPPIARILFR